MMQSWKDAKRTDIKYVYLQQGVQQAGAVAYVLVVRKAAAHTALLLAQVGQHCIPQMSHLAIQVPARTLHKHHTQSLHACHAVVCMCGTTDRSCVAICMPGVKCAFTAWCFAALCGSVHSIASSCASYLARCQPASCQDTSDVSLAKTGFSR